MTACDTFFNIEFKVAEFQARSSLVFCSFRSISAMYFFVETGSSCQIHSATPPPSPQKQSRARRSKDLAKQKSHGKFSWLSEK
jgi:hypothetical protein